MKPGTQIILVPHHANGDIFHPDSQAGFVTSIRGNTVFCRYWSNFSTGELRTKANSEGCDKSLLVEDDTVNQDLVDLTLRKIQSETL